MSVFVGNDSEATLEETLAFIDSIDLEHIISTAPSHSLPLKTHEEDSKRRPTATKKKKTRRRSNLSSSTQLQQRKKAELLYLRRRIQEMEQYIEQRKTQLPQMLNSRMALDYSTDKTTSWFELAAINYQARLESEETNRGLKAIMATQVQVSDTLREIVQMQGSFQEEVMLYTEALATPDSR
ncbi:hypothetical protein PI124_g11394 [Phytophthora idaei]|nr:hypothetical protein PI125_g13614 [Phytophthora idaei]KAG3153048.1 hypothetical protein PI126_g10254 [Phytophthora idaei]KAG3243791.1 hypothetical protein PI124_g11394 [Phytophthora idaei]